MYLSTLLLLVGDGHGLVVCADLGEGVDFLDNAAGSSKCFNLACALSDASVNKE